MKLFVFNNLTASFFGEFGGAFGHHAGGDRGQLRREDLAHRVLLRFKRVAGEVPPAGGDDILTTLL